MPTSHLKKKKEKKNGVKKNKNYKKRKKALNSWSFTKPWLERRRVLVFVSAIRFWRKPSVGFPVYEWSNKKQQHAWSWKYQAWYFLSPICKKYCWYHTRWPRTAPKRRCNETGLPERWLIPESNRGGHYALNGCKGTTIIIGRASSS